jgi:uncharacterized membrane protein
MDSTLGSTPPKNHRRFLEEFDIVAAPFGSSSFGARAESFARFFGTPRFLIGQTLIVGVWILINASGLVRFDLYPFILLNLAFSLQAAYAAPLILLAQTRQADRDKAHADADAQHREDVAKDSVHRQQQAEEGITLIKRLIDENTRLTKQVNTLTREIHGKIVTA